MFGQLREERFTLFFVVARVDFKLHFRIQVALLRCEALSLCNAAMPDHLPASVPAGSPFCRLRMSISIGVTVRS